MEQTILKCHSVIISQRTTRDNYIAANERRFVFVSAVLFSAANINFEVN